MSPTPPRPGPPRLIITKIRPPRRRRDLLTRPRLHELIGDSLERKLLLVSAPAGYGKTSLLVDYAHASGLPVCWYRLDRLDRDPMRFLEHLVASLRQRFPAACNGASALLEAQASSGSIDASAVVASLINDIDAHVDEFFLLVLDDYHHVADADTVNRALDDLLHYLPDTCQVVVSGRAVPSRLDVTRLAAAAQVAGIGQAQLRFTEPEIRDLLAGLHGRQLSATECEHLARDSEGWVTALVFGGQLLLDDRRAPVTDRAQLFQYLAQEVLARQPEPVQRFLLATSVLDDMSPPLCDALLGQRDGRRMLELLEAHNLFVTRVEGDGAWHRYHQLFRDFLAERLAADETIDVRGLHLRAARWLAAAGRAEDEIRHLLEAGDHDRAAERIALAVESAARRGRWPTIVDWAGALPEPLLRTRPLLLQRLGTALTYGGDLTGALRAYEWAAASYESAADREGLAALLARRAVLYRLLGRLDDALADGRRALASTSDAAGATAGLAHRALGGALSALGRMPEAVAELQAALRCYEATGERDLAASALNDLSAIHQWSGDADAAIEHAHRAIAHWQELGNPAAVAGALNNLGTAYHLRGDPEAARPWLEQAIDTAARCGYRRASALAHISMGDLLSDQDELAPAMDYYDQGHAHAAAIPDSALCCYALASRAEAHRLAGDVAAARADLARARVALERAGTAYERALLAFVGGTVRLTEGAAAAAVDELQAAADAFALLGARREESRALLYAVAAARSAGDVAAEARLQARAEAAAAQVPHPRCLAVHVARTAAGAAAAPLAMRRRRRPPLLPRRTAARADRRVAESASDDLRLLALGPPQVFAAGSAVERRSWQTAAAHDLLFVLVDNPQGLTRDRLMLLFWPDAPETRARGALHSTVHRVRRALGHGSVVQRAYDRYALSWPGPVRYDVADFLAELARAEEASGHSDRARHLDDALALVRGEYMDGNLADWCVERRSELDLRVTRAFLGLGQARSHLGEFQPAIVAYQQALARDPLREEGHRGLMASYFAVGDRAMALRQFEACARILDAELGTAPSDATRRLRERLVG